MDLTKLKAMLAGIQPTDASITLNNNILLVDGLNMFLRGFCMVNLTNESGHHVGALVGFLKSLGYAIKTIKPTRTIIIFDGVAGSDSRKNLYPAYKSNRHIGRITNFTIFQDKTDEEESINHQMARLLAYLMNTPVDLLVVDGIEADDSIGHLTKYFEADANCNYITIASADRDFLSLVSDKTTVYSPTKKKYYSPQLVLDEYGVTANNFLTQKILLGDKGDCVPNIPGFGGKKLPKCFPELSQPEPFTLQDVLTKCRENVDDKYYRLILEHQHQLEINERLMDLKNLNISKADIEVIEDIARATPKKLNKMNFLSMYYSDRLGNSIPNVEYWISEVFSYLDSFAN